MRPLISLPHIFFNILARYFQRRFCFEQEEQNLTVKIFGTSRLKTSDNSINVYVLWHYFLKLVNVVENWQTQ